LFKLIGGIAVFVGVENLPMVIHPAIPVGGGVEFHFSAKGVDLLILTAEEKVILIADSGVGAPASFQDLIVHLVDILLGLQGHLTLLIHGPGDFSG
jgi:hypothetical protein